MSEQENNKDGVGCFLIIVIVVGCLIFLYFQNPNVVDGERVKLKPGSTWNLNLETDAESPNGVYRLNKLDAYLVDGNDSIQIGVVDRDTLSKDFNNIKVEIVTLKGVPVISGKKDIVVRLKFDIPENENWLLRESTINVWAEVSYPYYDIVDATVGSMTGNVDMKTFTTPFRSQQDILITDEIEENNDLLIRRGVVILMGIAILVGIILFFRMKV
ncbi:MAG: hypothetical protein AB7O48_02940 [Cyclobacteriaceae bacterium]